MQRLDLQGYLDQLTGLLLLHGDPGRAKAAQKDKSTRFECLAIRVPVLREIATKQFALKDLSSLERLKVHDYIWNNANYYEVMSIPLLYYRAQKHRVERFQFDTIQHWVRRVDNWGHADELAVTFSFYNEKFRDDVFPYLQELNRSDDLWRIRISIVSLIHYSGKNAVYLDPDQAFPLVEPHLGDGEKYIANSVGWVLREYAKAYPEQTEAFVQDHKGEISSTALRRMKS